MAAVPRDSAPSSISTVFTDLVGTRAKAADKTVTSKFTVVLLNPCPSRDSRKSEMSFAVTVAMFRLARHPKKVMNAFIICS